MCCDCFSNPDHPKRKTSICLKIFVLLTMLIGAVLVFLSIFFGSVSVIAGVAIIVFDVIGLFGSGYYDGENSKKKICIIIYWLGLLVIMVLLVLGGLFFVVFSTNMVVWIADSTDITLLSHLVFIPLAITLLATSIILVIPFVFSSYLMGAKLFLKSVGLIGSCIISLLGVVVIFVFAKSYSQSGVAKTFSYLLIALIVFGAFLVLLSIFGVIGYAIEGKHKLPIRVFTVLLVLVVLAFLICSVIAMTMFGSAKEAIRMGVPVYCGVDDLRENETNPRRISQSKCFPDVKQVVYYLCYVEPGEQDRDMNPCPEELKKSGKCGCEKINSEEGIVGMTKGEFYAMEVEYGSRMVRANDIVAGTIGFFVVVFLLLMLISTLITSFCFKDEPEARWFIQM